MDLKNLIGKSKGYWWLIVGIGFFLGTTISSIIRSIDGDSFGSIVYLSIDWFAACIVYFFIGAMFGYVIDYLWSRKIKTPLWFWLTLALCIISITTVVIFAKNDLISPIGKALFPLAYGLFFVGMSYTMIFPDIVVNSYYGKLVFDLTLLGMFGSWIYFTLKNKKQKIAKILLLIMFFLLFLGFYGCAKALS